MADDKAVAMIEPLGGFRMQTGPVLESTIDYECYFPANLLNCRALATCLACFLERLSSV